MSLASELNRLATALTRIAKRDRRTRDFTRNAIRRALVEIVACFPVYRTYVDARAASPRRPPLHRLGRRRRQAPQPPPARRTVFDFIARAAARRPAPGRSRRRRAPCRRFVHALPAVHRAGDGQGRGGHLVLLLQPPRVAERSGRRPAHVRLHRAGVPRRVGDRATTWPHTMLATSTHDNKRGEDVRTRIDVLSEMPAAWRLALRRWRQTQPAARSTVERRAGARRATTSTCSTRRCSAHGRSSRLAQASLDAFRERIQAYMLKAAREAKVAHELGQPERGVRGGARAASSTALLGTLEPQPLPPGLRAAAAAASRTSAASTASRRRS